MVELWRTVRGAFVSPPLEPLPILYTNVWDQLPPPITSRSRSLSSVMTPNGEIFRTLSVWLHLVRHCWVFPIHVPPDSGHVSGLGLFGTGAAYDYRWLSVTCKWARTDSGHHHSSCYPLDRDNHSCPCPSPGFRCPMPSCPSVSYLPIFTCRNSVAVDYSN